MKRAILLFLIAPLIGWSQGKYEQKFEQLGTMLPTPNSYRTAGGAPGPEYWQQKADYKISVTLNDEKQSITGSEEITYYNQSPNPITYLWVQLDQNMRASDSPTPKIGTSRMDDTVSAWTVNSLVDAYGKDYGFKIDRVYQNGEDLTYRINQTMMRVEIPEVLKPGESLSFNIDWHYNINDRALDGGRSGYEYFPEDDNYLYTVAQFFPRMAVYDDVNGWQNKQFLGRGEFALTFGDYEVEITVPEDHIVAATGTLQNADEVLTKAQLNRWEKAQDSEDIIIVVTEEEAIENEKDKAKKTETWKFKADNVRDFAFASSRKFIWDAQMVPIGDKKPLAMSFYPKEGNPLWEEESTKAVKNTLITFSKYTIDYPYPVAISVHTASIGMEYPMICFNYGRPNPDGTYSERKKYGMISVIIHEVGHNFFPMIINSDERQWTWMDEGLNSFVQYRTEQEMYEDYPSRRGPAENIIDYMRGDKQYIRPIMTNSEQIIQFGNNAYGKPATALSILRETVMGPELFDYAFKEYSRRWAFKHPMPADFFRSMEDASAVDLDWFWKGWFYTTDHVDIAVDNVKWYVMQSDEEGIEGKSKKAKKGDLTEGKSGSDKMMDFSAGPTEFHFDPYQRSSWSEFKTSLDNDLVKSAAEGKNFYEVTLQNVGGLVMPVILEFTYADGSKEIKRIPAEIWRRNENEVKKVFVTEKEVTNIQLDPFKETADVDPGNNTFPREEVKSRFDEYQEGE